MVEFPASDEYTFTLEIKGDLIWDKHWARPKFRLKVGNNTISEATVNSSNYIKKTLTKKVEKGTYTLSVAFINDAYWKCKSAICWVPPGANYDSNLYVKSISITPTYSTIPVSRGRYLLRNVKPVIIHPQKPNTIYAGTFNGKLYRSDDFGENWQRLFVEGKDRPIHGIAVSPVDPDLILATISNGMIRSSDGGITWEVVSSGWKEGVRVLKADPLVRDTFSPRQHSNLLATSQSR